MEILLTGHRIHGASDEFISRLAANNDYIQLQYTTSVDAQYNPNPGVIALFEGSKIGWIPHAIASNHQLRSFGFKEPVTDGVICRAVRIYTQSTGYPGLALLPEKEFLKSITKPDQPKTEQSPMRTPSIQEIVNANVNAAQSAAKLEVGRVANDQLSKIIAARLPKQYGELLQTPIGQLALANAFAVASKATCPENKNVQIIVNMMTLDAYQQLFKLLDVPGIVAELMGNDTIAEALAQEAKDE